jgi:hypothetical protein
MFRSDSCIVDNQDCETNVDLDHTQQFGNLNNNWCCNRQTCYAASLRSLRSVFQWNKTLLQEKKTAAIDNVRSRGWSVSDKRTKFVETQQWRNFIWTYSRTHEPKWRDTINGTTTSRQWTITLLVVQTRQLYSHPKFSKSKARKNNRDVKTRLRRILYNPWCRGKYL